MKKLFVMSAAFFLLFGIASHAGAAGEFTALAPIPGLTENVGIVNSDSLANFFNNLYKYLIGLAAILAIVEIIWGGLEIATQDSISKQGSGRNRIKQALIGLALVLSPVLVFSIINPRILNLSLGLPPINVRPAGANTPAGSDNPAAPTVGCTTSGSSYLVKVTCAPQGDQDAEVLAMNYSCPNGLELRIPEIGDSGVCTRSESGGRCLSAEIYCAGRTTELTYYILYNWQADDSPSDPVIPADRSSESEFINGCRNDGGVVEKETTLRSRTFLAAQGHRFSENCPENVGIEFNPRETPNLVCIKKTVSCNPPN